MLFLGCRFCFRVFFLYRRLYCSLLVCVLVCRVGSLFSRFWVKGIGGVCERCFRFRELGIDGWKVYGWKR